MKNRLLLLLVLALLFSPASAARAAGTEYGRGHPAPTALPRWQQLYPASSPPARSEPGLAYDSARRVAVLFGGYDGDAR
ncbi:MAG: hypothetical protein HY784_01625, partial [Chloroflexi bacterium]|nr:hypothetical protein [Chloroflexota bacterium]